MHITSEEKRLSIALINLSACEHLQSSKLRKASGHVLTLLFEQLIRNRKVNLHERPLKDGTYKSDVFLQLSKTCPHMRTVIGCWLDTKKNIKWGGPLCGYFDPNWTVFIVDLNALKHLRLRKMLSRLDETLWASAIKTWGCLEWSPVTTWFKEVVFEGMGVGNWPEIRRQWKNPSFQLFAKHVRIDMSGIELKSPIILLDAVLSYLGPKHSIDIFDIKVNSTTTEPWPVPRKNEEAGVQEARPVVPTLASVWKWQNICDPWSEEYASMAICTCCWKRRTSVRYWNIAEDRHRGWDSLKLSKDHECFDYRAVQWTCTERRYWEWKRFDLPEGSWTSWFDFYECSITDTKTDNICTLLDNFLVDIGAT